jgi:hypothetical protein
MQEIVNHGDKNSSEEILGSVKKVGVERCHRDCNRNKRQTRMRRVVCEGQGPVRAFYFYIEWQWRAPGLFLYQLMHLTRPVSMQPVWIGHAWLILLDCPNILSGITVFLYFNRQTCVERADFYYNHWHSSTPSSTCEEGWNHYH